MIKIAIIGLGAMGSNHYRIMQRIGGVRIVALCDPQKEAKDYTHPFFKSLDAMLERVAIDAAIIAVPTFLHKEVALKCIEKQIDLFIEKPVTSNVSDAKAIADAVAATGIKCTVGHVERFNPVIAALKSELEQKEIYTIEATRVGPFPPRIADVGILTDLAVHDIDLIRFITQKEIEEVAIFKSQKIHNHHEDNAVIGMKLQSDIVASITTSWLTPYKERVLEVACKEGLFVADLMMQELTEYSRFEGTHTYNSYAVRKCFVQKQEPLLTQMQAFVHYLYTDQRGELATIEDSIATLRTVNGI